MAQISNEYQRIYVNVDVRFDPAGRMVPRTLIWTDGRSYEIDKVLDVRPAHAQKAGGQGDRYKVSVLGRERELFFEHSTQVGTPQVGRWFVEGKTR